MQHVKPVTHACHQERPVEGANWTMSPFQTVGVQSGLADGGYTLASSICCYWVLRANRHKAEIKP